MAIGIIIIITCDVYSTIQYTYTEQGNIWVGGGGGRGKERYIHPPCSLFVLPGL